MPYGTPIRTSTGQYIVQDLSTGGYRFANEVGIHVPQMGGYNPCGQPVFGSGIPTYRPETVKETPVSTPVADPAKVKAEEEAKIADRARVDERARIAERAQAEKAAAAQKVADEKAAAAQKLADAKTNASPFPTTAKSFGTDFDKWATDALKVKNGGDEVKAKETTGEDVKSTLTDKLAVERQTGTKSNTASANVRGGSALIDQSSGDGSVLASNKALIGKNQEFAAVSQQGAGANFIKTAGAKTFINQQGLDKDSPEYKGSTATLIGDKGAGLVRGVQSAESNVVQGDQKVTSVNQKGETNSIRTTNGEAGSFTRGTQIGNQNSIVSNNKEIRGVEGVADGRSSQYATGNQATNAVLATNRDAKTRLLQEKDANATGTAKLGATLGNGGSDVKIKGDGIQLGGAKKDGDGNAAFDDKAAYSTGGGNDVVDLTEAKNATGKLNTGGGADTVKLGKQLPGGEIALSNKANGDKGDTVSFAGKRSDYHATPVAGKEGHYDFHEAKNGTFDDKGNFTPKADSKATRIGGSESYQFSDQTYRPGETGNGLETSNPDRAPEAPKSEDPGREVVSRDPERISSDESSPQLT